MPERFNLKRFNLFHKIKQGINIIDISTHKNRGLKHKRSRKYLEKLKNTLSSLVVLLGNTREQRGKPFSLHLLSPLSLSSFFLFPFSLIPHVLRGLSPLTPLCLVNKRGKRWPKSATFPLEPTHFFQNCRVPVARTLELAGARMTKNPESKFWSHGWPKQNIYMDVRKITQTIMSTDSTTLFDLISISLKN